MRYSCSCRLARYGNPEFLLLSGSNKETVPFRFQLIKGNLLANLASVMFGTNEVMPSPSPDVSG